MFRQEGAAVWMEPCGGHKVTMFHWDWNELNDVVY